MKELEKKLNALIEIRSLQTPSEILEAEETLLQETIEVIEKTIIAWEVIMRTNPMSDKIKDDIEQATKHLKCIKDLITKNSRECRWKANVEKRLFYEIMNRLFLEYGRASCPFVF